jgi:hypothetical protein
LSAPRRLQQSRHCRLHNGASLICSASSDGFISCSSLFRMVIACAASSWLCQILGQFSAVTQHGQGSQFCREVWHHRAVTSSTCTTRTLTSRAHCGADFDNACQCRRQESFTSESEVGNERQKKELEGTSSLRSVACTTQCQWCCLLPSCIQ